MTVIAPKVAGFIASVNVADNQAVHAGDLLVKLDDRDYRAALAKAVAAVAGRQATLANLEATRRLREAEITEAEAEVAASDAEIARARDDQARYRQLAANGNASVQTFQKADADNKKAIAAGAHSRAALEAARRQLDVIDAQQQQAEAALAGAVADRDIAQLNLGYTEIRAPVDGAVGNRSARPGAYATIGAQIMSIVPAKGLWVDANFKESQLAGMRPGQSAATSPRTCFPARRSTAMSRASPRRPARNSASCRPKMRPAISPRLCSACRCASRSMATLRCLGACGRGCRSPPRSTSVPGADA